MKRHPTPICHRGSQESFQGLNGPVISRCAWWIFGSSTTSSIDRSEKELCTSLCSVRIGVGLPLAAALHLPYFASLHLNWIAAQAEAYAMQTINATKIDGCVFRLFETWSAWQIGWREERKWYDNVFDAELLSGRRECFTVLPKNNWKDF